MIVSMYMIVYTSVSLPFLYISDFCLLYFFMLFFLRIPSAIACPLTTILLEFYPKPSDWPISRPTRIIPFSAAKSTMNLQLYGHFGRRHGSFTRITGSRLLWTRDRTLKKHWMSELSRMFLRFFRIFRTRKPSHPNLTLNFLQVPLNRLLLLMLFPTIITTSPSSSSTFLLPVDRQSRTCSFPNGSTHPVLLKLHPLQLPKPTSSGTPS